jgi:hypothetical protein
MAGYRFEITNAWWVVHLKVLYHSETIQQNHWRQYPAAHSALETTSGRQGHFAVDYEKFCHFGKTPNQNMRFTANVNAAERIELNRSR